MHSGKMYMLPSFSLCSIAIQLHRCDIIIIKTFLYVDALDKEICERTRGKQNEKGCNCGRRKKGDESTTSSCNTSRCPCFAAKLPCSRVCRCKRCGNPQCNDVPIVHNELNVECSCHKSPVACKDSNTRKSKCPCLINRKQCGSTCKCKNCGNGKLSNVPNAESGVHKRKRNYEPIFKRKKGCDYLAQQGFDINCGTWTDIETIFLITISEILQESPLDNNTVNCSFLYRHLASSSILKNSGLTIGQKRNSQIAGKMMYMKRKQDVHFQMIAKEKESQNKK